MRAKSSKKTALLVTDDPAVETTVRSVTEELGHGLRHLQTARDAMCVVTDAGASEVFVIVDLDGHTVGRRTLLNTAGGMLPVIALCKEERPWLSSMVRRRRIEASIAKPVTSAALTEEIHRAQAVTRAAEDFADRASSWLSASESDVEKDFDRTLRQALRYQGQ